MPKLWQSRSAASYIPCPYGRGIGLGYRVRTLPQGVLSPTRGTEGVVKTIEDRWGMLNDINFGDYIEDILTRLMEGEQDFMSLIPCNYNSNKKVNVKAA